MAPLQNGGCDMLFCVMFFIIGLVILSLPTSVI